MKVKSFFVPPSFFLYAHTKLPWCSLFFFLGLESQGPRNLGHLGDADPVLLAIRALVLAGTTLAFLASIVGRVLGTSRDSLERLSWFRLGLLGPKDHLDVAIEDGACALHCRVGLYT